MRLVCPNCEAKYEVPDDAVPDTGRDVQCTNCGHTWYQMRGRSGASLPLTGAIAETVAEPAAAVAEPDLAPVTHTEEAGPAVAAPVTEAVTAAEAGPVDEAATVEADAVAAEPLVHEVFPETAADDLAPGEAQAADTETISPGAEDAGAHQPAAAMPETEVTAGDEPPPVAEPEPPAEAGPEPVAVADLAADQNPEGAAAAVSPVPDIAPAPAAYAVDDSVLAILREEAEREANARRADALESQTDLGIDAAMPGKAGKGKVAVKPAEVEAKPSARRDLLPDVEEINSTLRPSEAALGDAATPDFVAPPPQAPHGFRSGFLTLMTIAILAAALYIVAPRLAALVPVIAGPLDTYVSLVDSLRLGLDGMMRSATVAINGG